MSPISVERESFDAVRDWIDTLDRIPRALVERAYFVDGIPTPAIRQLTGFLDVCDECGAEQEMLPQRLAAFRARYPQVSFDDEDLIARLRCESCHEKESLTRSFGTRYGGLLPAWRTLWAFSHPHDVSWAKAHLDVMESLGFVVYHTDDIDVLFGIDGAGYDFVSQHFLPLYTALFSLKPVSRPQTEGACPRTEGACG